MFESSEEISGSFRDHEILKDHTKSKKTNQWVQNLLVTTAMTTVLGMHPKVVDMSVPSWYPCTDLAQWDYCSARVTLHWQEKLPIYANKYYCPAVISEKVSLRLYIFGLDILGFFFWRRNTWTYFFFRKWIVASCWRWKEMNCNFFVGLSWA